MAQRFSTVSATTAVSGAEVPAPARVLTYLLQDDGMFPNNGRLPLVVYRQAVTLPCQELATLFEALFAMHHWGGWVAHCRCGCITIAARLMKSWEFFVVRPQYNSVGHRG